jgi:hypothetical protein
VNISVAIGRDATFTCHVKHLGGYRVNSFSNNLILAKAALDINLIYFNLCELSND